MIWEATNRRRSDREQLPLRPRLTPAEFRGVLGRIHDTTEKAGAELLLLVWGYRRNVTQEHDVYWRDPWQMETYKFARDRSVAIIDLVAIFQEMCRKHPIDDVFFDFGHATSLANQKVAQAVAEYIAPWLAKRHARPSDPP